MIEIDIANQQSSVAVDIRSLESAIGMILDDYGLRAGSISLAVVTDSVIHQLNRQYLDHDYSTDVLSFVFDRSNDRIEGEVIVSADTARLEAANVGWPPEHELLLYVIHGVLHLVGCDDKHNAAQRVMRDEERKYLAACGVPFPQGATSGDGGLP